MGDAPKGEYWAEDTAKALGEIPDMAHTEEVPQTISAFMGEVVERGTFWPDARVSADLSLTARERLTGKRTQDVTAILCIGLVLGAALERDIPVDSELEEAWRDGQFKLGRYSTD